MDAMCTRYSFGMITIRSAAFSDLQFEPAFFADINLAYSHIVAVHHNTSHRMLRYI
jgi:hypothetical protein